MNPLILIAASIGITSVAFAALWVIASRHDARTEKEQSKEAGA